MNTVNTSKQNQTETTLAVPEQLKAQLPLSPQLAQHIAHQRQSIQDILDGKDHRLLVITGPCSIHDEKSALDHTFFDFISRKK